MSVLFCNMFLNHPVATSDNFTYTTKTNILPSYATSHRATHVIKISAQNLYNIPIDHQRGEVP